MASIEEHLDYESFCACGYKKAVEDVPSRRQLFLKQMLMHPLALQARTNALETYEKSTAGMPR